MKRIILTMDSKNDYKFKKNKITKKKVNNEKKNLKKKEKDCYKYLEINLCIECGIDMGPNNPRQLCGKIRCLYSN